MEPELMFLVYVGSFFLAVVITRWIFLIDRQIKNQRAMIWFLMKIAKQQGLAEEEINKAIRDFRLK